MGRLLCGSLRREYGVRLNPSAYLLGNVIPDFLPSLFWRPHYLCFHEKHLQNALASLLRTRNTAWNGQFRSFRFGMLCHFYADFFCYAHSDFFRGSLNAHIRYEAVQHRYFKEHRNELLCAAEIPECCEAPTGSALYRRFETLHECYLSCRNSFGNDLAFTILACMETAVLLFHGAEQNPDAEADGICVAV